MVTSNIFASAIRWCTAANLALVQVVKSFFECPHWLSSKYSVMKYKTTTKFPSHNIKRFDTRTHIRLLNKHGRRR